MCGIVGYIGKKNALPYLMNGLSKLEYRGYDSAGISLFEKDNILTVKAKGRINHLEKKLESIKTDSNTGIAHTRWATHGVPDEKNAHPHLSRSGLFSVVHNGIIENSQKLKDKLIKDGYEFKSDTDTEVIAHLLEQNFCGDVLSSLSKTLFQLEGSYALAVLCKEEKALYLAAKESPLVCGKIGSGVFIASDINAFPESDGCVYSLCDGEIAALTDEKIRIFTKDLKRAEKKGQHIEAEEKDEGKGDFAHFMLKEIFEQPKAVRETLKPYIKSGKIDFEHLKLSKEQIAKITNITFVACGSAYHVGMLGAYLTEEMARIYSTAQIASEFRYSKPCIDKNSLVVFISQSGETADTLAALRLAKEKGANVVSVVNVKNSSIAKESPDVIYTSAGPEIAVATTKAYSTQLAAVYLLSAFLAEKRGVLSEAEVSSFLNEVLSLPGKIEECLLEEKGYKALSNVFSKDVFFIGRNKDYPTASEGALKMKEISYLPCQAYASGELKHGTISLIEKGSIVVALCCNNSIFGKCISNIKEVKARGAFVFALTPDSHKNDLPDADVIITVPDCDDKIVSSLSVIPLQLLSYYAALQKGRDIDKPRNLAKSVTVE